MTIRSFAPRDRLDGQVVVITGGTGAIGSATAKRMASLGARVAILHRGQAGEATRLIAGLEGVGHIAVEASVTDSASLSLAARTVREQMGGATILVNCAGFTKPVPARDLDGLTDELIDETFRVNWRGLFATIRAFTSQLQDCGEGVIVNVSSIAASSGLGSNLAYAAVKAGTDALTKGLAKTLAPQVRVLAVSPGVVDTPFVPGRGADFNEKVGATIPLKRVGVADDVASAIVACCTSMVFATGSIFVADGGRHLG
jgi:3-oxoacyl-[acyl-carrier protein] reductase